MLGIFQVQKGPQMKRFIPLAFALVLFVSGCGSDNSQSSKDTNWKAFSGSSFTRGIPDNGDVDIKTVNYERFAGTGKLKMRFESKFQLFERMPVVPLSEKKWLTDSFQGRIVIYANDGIKPSDFTQSLSLDGFSSGENFYAMEAEYGASCWDMKNGFSRWSKQILCTDIFECGGKLVVFNSPDGSFARLHTQTGDTIWRLAISDGPCGPFATLDGKIYCLVSEGEGKTALCRIDPATGAVVSIVLEKKYVAVAGLKGRLWLLAQDDTIAEFDAQTGTIIKETGLKLTNPKKGNFGAGLDVLGNVICASWHDNSLTMTEIVSFDPNSGKILEFAEKNSTFQITNGQLIEKKDDGFYCLDLSSGSAIWSLKTNKDASLVWADEDGVIITSDGSTMVFGE